MEKDSAAKIISLADFIQKRSPLFFCSKKQLYTQRLYDSTERLLPEWLIPTKMNVSGSESMDCG